jgi:hypothetical protein
MRTKQQQRVQKKAALCAKLSRKFVENLMRTSESTVFGQRAAVILKKADRIGCRWPTEQDRRRVLHYRTPSETKAMYYATHRR